MKRNLIYLSQWDDSRTIALPEQIGPILKNYEIIGIRFMYDAYIKKRKGIILNEEEEMNVFLQIAAFLSALFNSKKIENVALVVCSQKNLTKWFYHLSNHGNFQVSMLTHEYVSAFSQENNVVLVSINNVKFLKTCERHEFFSIVIENLEDIAGKLILKKLTGEFNIGITYKNFLLERNQNVQFNMLKWINPDKYSKLSQFTQEDNEHFENCIDAYSDDWLRLTWSYSETFKKNSSAETEEYELKVAEYAKEKNLFQFKIEKKRKSDKTTKKTSKRVLIRTENSSPEKSEECENMEGNNQHTKTKETEKHIKIQELEKHTDMKYENNCYEENLPSTSYSFENSSVKLPCMDESPILTSIIRNLQGSTETDVLKTTITKESILSSLMSSPDQLIASDSCSTSKISHNYNYNNPSSILGFFEDDSE